MCSVGDWRDSRGSYYHPGPEKIGHENMTTKGGCKDFLCFWPSSLQYYDPLPEFACNSNYG